MRNNLMSGGGPRSGAGNRPKDGQAGKQGAPNLDEVDKLNIPDVLKPIIDDSDDEFPLRFKDHNELIDIFSGLEENNLLEIIRMQESE